MGFPTSAGRFRALRRAIALPVVAAGLTVVVLVSSSVGPRPARAADSGALDFEIANRAIVAGAIGAERELDTLRLRMPEDAALRLTVQGAGKVRPRIRVFRPDDVEVDIDRFVRGRGATVKVLPFVAGPAGLYRIDVRSEGTSTGKYTLQASWTLPPKESFSGTTASEGAFYTFDAEAGTRITALVRTAEEGGTARVVGIRGPFGYEYAFPAPGRPSAKHKVRSPALPRTGRYHLDLLTDVGGREISGSIARSAPTKPVRLNLRSAERRGTGVARTVSRRIEEDGGDVDVPRLEEQQRVSLDASGVCLSVPAGSLPFPAVYQVRTDDDAIDDPLGFAPAGVSVNFDAGGNAFDQPVSITLPYDVGAFEGDEVLSEICILRRTEDGGVFEMPRSSAVVDFDAGTVTFPTSQFSSYQVFSPPVELSVVARAGKPNDLAADPDAGVVYMTIDLLSPENPAAAVLSVRNDGTPEIFAGGGLYFGDGVDRLDYDFDGDMGGGGAIVSALAVGPGGELLIVTGDLQRTRSVVYIVISTGQVVRVAGDGTSETDEDLPARDTGLPFCDGAAFRADGNVVVVTDSFRYPESDRVYAITADGIGLEGIRIRTVAGGGTADVSGFHPLETRLLQPRAILLDAEQRILVGDRDWLVRFDLEAGTTTTIAGTNYGETEAGVGRTLGGLGAPLRTVVLGALDDLAFAPWTEDVLYAADPEAGIVWRFDLARDRAYIAAGRRLDFERSLETREPDPDAVDPDDPLSFPVAVAPLAHEVFIAERFDDRLFSLRRANR